MKGPRAGSLDRENQGGQFRRERLCRSQKNCRNRPQIGGRTPCVTGCWGIPPPPRSCGMSRLRRKSRKIFDVKELIGKIFRTKELAQNTFAFGVCAQRVTYILHRRVKDRT